MSNKAPVREKLQALGVSYAYHEHAPAMSMADCLALPWAAEDVTFCKNILLCDRQQQHFYLYVTLPDKVFRTSAVSHAIGSSRLSFAPEDALKRLLETQSGSLSPLGMWFDREKQVRLVFDRSVRRPGRIAFHPCDNTATCVFAQEVFWRDVLPTLEHEPLWIDV